MKWTTQRHGWSVEHRSRPYTIDKWSLTPEEKRKFLAHSGSYRVLRSGTVIGAASRLAEAKKIAEEDNENREPTDRDIYGQ